MKKDTFSEKLRMVKKKLKPILPSLREKKRYLVFEVISKKQIANASVVYGALHTSTIELLGSLGASKAGIMFLKDKYNQDLQRGMIKVNHKYVDHLRSALLMVEKIDNTDVIVKSVGVSGILNKAEQKYLAG